MKLIRERGFRHSGVSVLTKDGKRFIIINPARTAAQTIVTIAHELGHHVCGLTDTPDRNESAANRWAVKRLISLQDIIDGTISGCQSYFDLADRLNLEPNFVRRSVELLAQMHGREIKIGKYKLHLLPIWVEDMETGQFWPEY